jgi:hypothetical protein
MPQAMALIAFGVWMGLVMLASRMPVITLQATLGTFGVRNVASKAVHFDAGLMMSGD